MIKNLFIALLITIAVSTYFISQSSSTIGKTYNLVEPSELKCLAKNIYFESRNESTAGKVAVAQTTINRVKSKKFPNTICDVVYQGGEKLNRCQFSWFCDGKPDLISNPKAWKESLKIAETVMFQGDWMIDITDGATFYHANYVDPYWAATKRKLVSIDTHIFYR